ncbi:MULTISPECIES: anti-sigma factor [Allobacillus]|uniref:Anti-sigma factor n=1 Tax=Allobacillus salarius TaxID=1955272 RepID=A0A556P8R5_9BACI|nr:anti-sigma factor [Allobacillus salarius]TSJ60768.1 anti-sigma factor [Allobacillus salarius]
MSDDQNYWKIIDRSKKQFDQNTNIDSNKILKKSRHKALTTNILISLAILLMIVPTLTLLTYFYYGTGDGNGRANKQIEVASNVIELTEPNMYVKRMELEEQIDFFSMDLNFDVYKRIGKEEYRVGEYDINYMLDQPDFPDRNLWLDRPHQEIPQKDEASYIIHPLVSVPYEYDREWDIVESIPDGTVVEAYLSFTDSMDPDDVKDINPGLDPDIEFLWLAVDTGIEKKVVDDQGLPVTPIGYPIYKDPPNWTPFDNREDNEVAFTNTLNDLEHYESQATKIARAKTLALDERTDYIQENGVKIYGAVVTGPAPEIRKLKNNDHVRSLKVGEVKLWNWH